MREVRLVSRTPLSRQALLDTVFGKRGLRVVHGPSLELQPWDHQEARQYSFVLQSGTVAPLLRKFVPPEFRICVKQVKRELPTTTVLLSKLRLQLVGQELFQIRPRVTLRDCPEGTEVETYTRLDALLPPFLSSMAEDFMAANARAELEKIHAFIRNSS